MTEVLVVILIAGQGFAWGFLAGRNNARHIIREYHRLQKEIARYGVR